MASKSTPTAAAPAGRSRSRARSWPGTRSRERRQSHAICSGSGISSGGLPGDRDRLRFSTSVGDLQNTDPRFNSVATDRPQANGGDTDTLGFDAISPAVNRQPRSPPFCSGADQRGVGRPQGDACDIGAFELFEPVAGKQGTIQVGYQDCLSPTRYPLSHAARTNGDPT